MTFVLPITLIVLIALDNLFISAYFIKDYTILQTTLPQTSTLTLFCLISSIQFLTIGFGCRSKFSKSDLGS